MVLGFFLRRSEIVSAPFTVSRFAALCSASYSSVFNDNLLKKGLCD